MFEHSIKVPRHYKIAANILKKVSTEGGSVKALLYDNKLRHFRTNVLFALITETIKHATYIDKIFESSDLFTKESRLDPWLAKILTAELIFGKKSLPGKSKPEQTILSYKEHFEKYTAEHQGDLKTGVVRRPRYVRVNTNLLTTSDAIRAFQDEGYHFIRCTSGSYDDYLAQIQSLTEYDFTQDYHVKTVFIFAPGTKLHEHELYLENKIILQDKATTMAVHLLAPPPGSTALDMCAAPGMKTTQLAAFMKNEGKIYAVERNEQRYQTLCDFVEKTGSKCVETIHKDSLEIKRGDYDDVEYILLDPSCSGSGMEFCVHNYVEDSRLAKLTSLQEKFLKHAMNAFPKAKRIVYSTCSLYPEENERVITNTVKTSRAKWRVLDVIELLKGQWNNVGSGMYGSIGTRCLYAKPESDFTTGFFLAVLDREHRDIEKKDKQDNDQTMGDVKIKKITRKPDDNTNQLIDDNNDDAEHLSQVNKTIKCENVDEYANSKSYKKKKNKSKLDHYSCSNDNAEVKKNITKKKSAKNIECEVLEDVKLEENLVIKESLISDESKKIKKKKDKRKASKNLEMYDAETSKEVGEEETEEPLINEETNTICIEENDFRKKKKKNKQKHVAEMENNEIEEPKKKKKKVKSSE